jgi:hypothetical protein
MPYNSSSDKRLAEVELKVGLGRAKERHGPCETRAYVSKKVHRTRLHCSWSCITVAMQLYHLCASTLSVASRGTIGIFIRHQRPAILFYRQRIQHFSARPPAKQVVPLLQETAAPSEDSILKHTHVNDKNGSQPSGDVAEDAQDAETSNIALNPEPSSSTTGHERTAEDLSNGSEATNSNVATDRREARRLRKLRRQQNGTFRPNANLKEAEALEGESTEENVLEKIDAMDGESVVGPSPTPKQSQPQSTAEQSTSETPQKNSKGASKENHKSQPETTTISKPKRPKQESWGVQKSALANKFGDAGWQPRKRLSPDTLEGIRTLHQSDKTSYSTEILAEHFKITPEAIRRILKSKWRPNEKEAERRRKRWERRGVRKWEEMSKEGARPPAKWRALGVKSPAARNREVHRERTRDDGYVKWADG